MTIGQKIMNMRKARGWSQEELADKIGVTRQAVSRWEADSSKPDADKIITLCDLFGVSADYLLREAYQGETRTTSVPEKTTALGRFIRGLTLRQWADVIIFAVGIILLLILKILQVAASMGEGLTWNFYDFIDQFQLVFLWYIAVAAAAYGAVAVILLPVLKWALDNNGQTRLK